MNIVPISHLQSTDAQPIITSSRLPGIEAAPPGWRVVEPVQTGRLRVLFADGDTLTAPAETSYSEAEAHALGVVAEDAFATSQYALARGAATAGFHATHLAYTNLGREYADAVFRYRPVEEHRLGRLSIAVFSALIDTGDVLLRVTFTDGRSLHDEAGGTARAIEVEERNRAFLRSL